MKKNGILFLALAAIAAGIYFSTRRAPAAPRVSSTGTAQYPADTFWNSILQRGTAIAGQSANRAVFGNPGGGANGGDLSPLIKGAVGAGVGILGGIGQRLKSWIGGTGKTSGTAPGTSAGYGSDDGYGYLFDDYSLTSEPQYSEGGGFQGPAWESSGAPYLPDFGGGEPQLWDNTNDLPIDDAYDSASSDAIFA